ncbi:MAG: glycerol dehydratase [Hyphomicrobiales bacterium]|nr:glycerol dehydratase [Hyphomicrobiales bacterium]
MKDKFRLADYPLAQNMSERIGGARGKTLDDLSMESLLAGDVTIEDLRITPEALLAQAEIARAAGRATLASNFERGAELVGVPQEVIMDTYEMLRPGRARTRRELTERAEMFRRDYGAEKLAAFLETAAEIYFRRGLLGE